MTVHGQVDRISGVDEMESLPYTVYATAKAGVVTFSRSLAYLAEEANIRVNAICRRMGDAEERGKRITVVRK